MPPIRRYVKAFSCSANTLHRPLCVSCYSVRFPKSQIRASFTRCSDLRVVAINERLFIENFPLSHVRRKRPLPRTQSKSSFLRVPTGPLMSSCVARPIIEDRKLRACTCTPKNGSRDVARFPFCLSAIIDNWIARIGSDIL